MAVVGACTWLCSLAGGSHGRCATATRENLKKLTLEGIEGLADARKAATTALHELKRGKDPAGLKFDAKAAEQRAAMERAGDTIDNLSAQFVERYAKKQTRENSWKLDSADI